MNNKNFASFTILVIIGCLGIWINQSDISIIDSWTRGYLTGLVSCFVFYIHRELS